MENIFKTLRTEKGLTQKEVAEKLYISPMSVSRWESGKSYPEYEILPKLAELYGVPLARLFGNKCKLYVDYDRKRCRKNTTQR